MNIEKQIRRAITSIAEKPPEEFRYKVRQVSYSAFLKLYVQLLGCT